MLWTWVEFGSDHLQSPGMSRFCVVLVMAGNVPGLFSERFETLRDSPEHSTLLGVPMPRLWCSFGHPAFAGGGCRNSRSPVQASQAAQSHQHCCRWATFNPSLPCSGPGSCCRCTLAGVGKGDQGGSSPLLLFLCWLFLSLSHGWDAEGLQHCSGTGMPRGAGETMLFQCKEEIKGTSNRRKLGEKKQEETWRNQEEFGPR